MMNMRDTLNLIEGTQSIVSENPVRESEFPGSYVLVFPHEAFGPFQSEEAAKEYLKGVFGHDEEAAINDTTWSIKPLREGA